MRRLSLRTWVMLLAAAAFMLSALNISFPGHITRCNGWDSSNPPPNVVFATSPLAQSMFVDRFKSLNQRHFRNGRQESWINSASNEDGLLYSLKSLRKVISIVPFIFTRYWQIEECKGTLRAVVFVLEGGNRFQTWP